MHFVNPKASTTQLPPSEPT